MIECHPIEIQQTLLLWGFIFYGCGENKSHHEMKVFLSFFMIRLLVCVPTRVCKKTCFQEYKFFPAKKLERIYCIWIRRFLGTDAASLQHSSLVKYSQLYTTLLPYLHTDLQQYFNTSNLVRCPMKLTNRNMCCWNNIAFDFSLENTCQLTFTTNLNQQQVIMIKCWIRSVQTEIIVATAL